MRFLDLLCDMLLAGPTSGGLFNWVVTLSVVMPILWIIAWAIIDTYRTYKYHKVSRYR